MSVERLSQIRSEVKRIRRERGEVLRQIRELKRLNSSYLTRMRDLKLEESKIRASGISLPKGRRKQSVQTINGPQVPSTAYVVNVSDDDLLIGHGTKTWLVKAKSATQIPADIANNLPPGSNLRVVSSVEEVGSLLSS